jgi:uncharacterized OsmC-like protein
MSSARAIERDMSHFSDPVVITCSISGAIANRDQCPAIPYTPQEYAAEAHGGDLDEATLVALHERAHESCFIANSVSCPVKVEPRR